VLSKFEVVTGMTVVSSKKGAYVDAAVMSGTSVSTMLMNVLPSPVPSRRQSSPDKTMRARIVLATVSA